MLLEKVRMFGLLVMVCLKSLSQVHLGVHFKLKTY